MTVAPEFMQFVGFALAMGLAFVGGVSWGRKNPNKVEELNRKLKDLEDKLTK